MPARYRHRGERAELRRARGFRLRVIEVFAPRRARARAEANPRFLAPRTATVLPSAAARSGAMCRSRATLSVRQDLRHEVTRSGERRLPWRPVLRRGEAPD